MNEEAHWNDQAKSYDDEIFDVFQSDKFKRLPVYFDKHADRSGTVIDFGCGVGKALSWLSPRFGEVIATDISDACLDFARKLPYDNIHFRQADLTRRSLNFPPADFAFCCNVVMLPERRQNEAMVRNICKSLKPGKSAVLVLPSLESILFATRRLIDWYEKEGTALGGIPESELSYYRNKRELLSGIVRISNVPTKHYLEPEVRALLEAAGFEVTALGKIEYEWTSEFERPPAWMKKPFPWDWLVEARKS